MPTEEPCASLRLRGRQCQVEGESNVHYSILQTRKEAQSTRCIAAVALLFAACSAVSMCLLLRWGGFDLEVRDFPEDMEVIEPGWAWTTVPAVVRAAPALDSTKLGVIPAKQRVLVSELRGVRARIKEPMEGWISCVSDGTQIVTRQEVDEELNQVRKKLLTHQKIQRNIDAALEKRKTEKGVPPPRTRSRKANQAESTTDKPS